MKNSSFSKILIIVFLFGGSFADAQVRVKTNKRNNKKNVVVKRTRTNPVKNKREVRVKNNRNRVVISKPKRPKVIIKRPNYNRSGFFWVQGYWKWSNFYGRYIWQKARWVKIKKNHFWTPGYWESSPGGFFWIEGYWQLEF